MGVKLKKFTNESPEELPQAHADAIRAPSCAPAFVSKVESTNWKMPNDDHVLQNFLDTEPSKNQNIAIGKFMGFYDYPIIGDELLLYSILSHMKI